MRQNFVKIAEKRTHKQHTKDIPILSPRLRIHINVTQSIVIVIITIVVVVATAVDIANIVDRIGVYRGRNMINVQEESGASEKKETPHCG